MPPAPSSEGLRSDALRVALNAAIAGKPGPLEDLLSRHGGGSDPRPNLRLAAAFGVEIAAAETPPGAAVRLLSRLGANDAAPDTPQVFLPVAAAHGWAAKIRTDRDLSVAWDALAALAGDERTPVRLGTLDALMSFIAHPGGATALLERALDWLALENRENRENRDECFGATAVVMEVFGDRRALAALADPELFLEYLSRTIAAVAEAPRSAERSDARRRLLLALPKTLGAVVLGLTVGDRGTAWLEGECARARLPDLREVLSNTVLGLRGKSQGAVVQRLRSALEGSAKPLRDPTRKRPGSDRGKTSRRVR